MNQATLRFQAGRLLCGQIRHFLECMEMEGYDIKWKESSGWLSRLFCVTGEESTVRMVMESLRKWQRENNIKEFD